MEQEAIYSSVESFRNMPLRIAKDVIDFGALEDLPDKNSSELSLAVLSAFMRNERKQALDVYENSTLLDREGAITALKKIVHDEEFLEELISMLEPDDTICLGLEDDDY